MGRRRTSPPAEVSKVLARVERWRGEREGWSRMPGDLWEAAVELARRHGVALVARELRLDYTSLKKRVVMEVSEPGNPRNPGQDGGGGSGGFVEMDPAGLAGVFGPVGPGGAEVEVREPDGTRLVVRLPGGEGREGLDVVGLVGAFRRWRA